MMKWFDEFVAGWGVIGHLAHAHIHAQPLHHKLYFLGWWWEGENVLIPELIAEAETANQFEELFPKAPTSPNSNITFAVPHQDAALAYNGSALTMGHSPLNSGTWYLTPHFGIGLKSPPHPLRRLAAFLVLGMRWEPKLPPEPALPLLPNSFSILKSRL